MEVIQMAKRIDVTTMETATGGLTVFAARGQILVDNSTQRDLTAVASADNDGLVEIGYDMGGSRTIRIDQYISNGSLRGLLDLRDTTIPDLQAKFDRLAATLTNAVNQIHRQGFGLDGCQALPTPQISSMSQWLSEALHSVIDTGPSSASMISAALIRLASRASR